MKRLLAAVFAVTLTPALVFAQVETTPPASTTTAPAAPATPAPAASTPTAPAARPAAAIGGAAAAADGTELAAQSGFGMGVSLDHSVGQGTFENAQYFAFVGGSLVLAPRYGFSVGGVKLGASANASVSYEYTPPDNAVGRRYNWSDIGLGLSAPAIWKDEKFTGIVVTPRIGLTLPVSIGSLFRGTITNLSGGIGLGRAFGRFNLGASVGVGRTFYGEVTRNITDAESKLRDQQQNVIFICRTDSTNCGLRGVPTLWSLSGGLHASYSPIDRLSFGLGLNMSKGFKYYQGVDEFSSKAQTSNGPAVRGQGTADNMVGSLSASYQLTDALGISASMGTAQPPRSADNRRFRFPFYAFEGQENGYTSYSVALSAAF